MRCKEEDKDRAKAVAKAGWAVKAWDLEVTAPAHPVEPELRTREEFPVTNKLALNVGLK